MTPTRSGTVCPGGGDVGPEHLTLLEPGSVTECI
jgi:hypothetical protein